MFKPQPKSKKHAYTNTSSSSSSNSSSSNNHQTSRLLQLPVELLIRIFVYAQNPALATSCEPLWCLGQSPILRAHYLLYRYGPAAALGETSLKRRIVSLAVIQQLLTPSYHCDPTADGSWLFIKACELNRVDLCQQILELVDPQHIPHMLNLAAMKGAIDVVDLLVHRFRANVHHETVLTLACQENRVAMVKHLATTYGCDVHAHHERHLRNACLHGHFELVQFLLVGADVHAYTDAALQNAVYKGFSAVAHLLLSAGARADTQNNVCIQHAIHRQDLHMVQCLIEHGGVDPRCDSDWPLRHACRRGLDAIVHYLIERVGKQIAVDMRDGVLLEECLVHGQKDTLQLLLDAGANPNCPCVIRGLRFLVKSSRTKVTTPHKDKMIKQLLDAGLQLSQQPKDILAPDIKGQTVLTSILAWI